MNDKTASEQIGILENITIQVLQETVKAQKQQKKRIKFSISKEMQEKTIKSSKKNEIATQKPTKWMEMSEKLT